MDETIAINKIDVTWECWEYICFKSKADPFKTNSVLLHISRVYADEQ